MWDPVNCWCQSQAGRVSCRAALCLDLLGDLGQRPFLSLSFPTLEAFLAPTRGSLVLRILAPGKTSPFWVSSR